MKMKMLTGIVISSLLSYSATAQEKPTGFAGDHFNLNGALEAFRQASSPEAFEKLLNKQDNHINNLDLNEDGKVDYIKVINRREKNVQLFILQVPVTENENQDIAVIELEQTGGDEAVVQIVGDKDIFGEETIVEPAAEDDRNSFTGAEAPVTHGPAVFSDNNALFVNVWFWPSVRFVFAPGYRVYVSPWKWHHHPRWYAARKPKVWKSWYPNRNYYHRYYTPYPHHRIVQAPKIYKPMRRHSATVYHRHHPSVSHHKVKYKTVPASKSNGPVSHAKGKPHYSKKRR